MECLVGSLVRLFWLFGQLWRIVICDVLFYTILLIWLEDEGMDGAVMNSFEFERKRGFNQIVTSFCCVFCSSTVFASEHSISCHYSWASTNHQHLSRDIHGSWTWTNVSPFYFQMRRYFLINFQSFPRQREIRIPLKCGVFLILCLILFPHEMMITFGESVIQ